MNSKITIRSYAPTDYEAVHALYENSKTYGGQFDADRDSKMRLDQQSGEEVWSILVAEEGGVIVGTVSILADKRFAWLVRFAVTNTHSADLLYEAAIKILSERGHKQVLVYAPTSDPSFEARYDSLGFNKGADYTCFWREI